MNEYRVKELNGKFYIQVKVIEKSGFLWWEKETTSWYSCDHRGFPRMQIVSMLAYMPFIKLEPFNSLEDARIQIEMFQEEPKYHYIK